MLAALERRRRTRKELEAVLERKGFDAALYGSILDRFAEVGLIDDLEYARVFIRRRVAGKPRGARLLRAELLGRGVPVDHVERALAEYHEEAGDPLDAAERALVPLLRRSAGLEPQKLRQKAWQFLARRGFSGDVAERAIRRISAAGDEDREPE